MPKCFPKSFIWGGSASFKLSDLEQMSYLGLNSYRFRVSWSDLFETGDVTFYDEILKACQTYHLCPMVEIGDDFIDDRHLHDLRTLFKHYQNSVQYWLILPDENIHALKLKNFDRAYFANNHRSLIAYAKIITLLKEVIPSAIAGPSLTYVPAYALDNVPENAMARLSYNDMMIYYWLDMYVHGMYPPSVRAYWQYYDLTPDLSDMDLMKKASSLTDFIGLSYHSSITVAFNPVSGIHALDDHHIGIPGLFRSRSNQYLSHVKNGDVSDAVGLRYALCELTSRYQLPLFVRDHSLNVSEKPQTDMLNDPYRIDDLREHLKQVKMAMDQGVQMLGFCTTFTDHEAQCDGLVCVQGDKRILKDSYFYMKHVIETGGEDLS